MPPVVFTLAARQELFQAIDWYEARRPGLGGRFAGEVDVLVSRIREHPGRFVSVGKGVRRAVLRDFPYGLFFLIHPDLIQVIACFHASRNPLRWQERRG